MMIDRVTPNHPAKNRLNRTALHKKRMIKGIEITMFQGNLILGISLTARAIQEKMIENPRQSVNQISF